MKALILALALLTACAPAQIQRVQQPTVVKVEEEKTFPCTRDDINRCNACERDREDLKQLLLKRPPDAFSWSQTAKIAAVTGAIGIFIGTVGGVWLGSKL